MSWRRRRQLRRPALGGVSLGGVSLGGFVRACALSTVSAAADPVPGTAPDRLIRLTNVSTPRQLAQFAARPDRSRPPVPPLLPTAHARRFRTVLRGGAAAGPNFAVWECRAEAVRQAASRDMTGWMRSTTVAMQGPRCLALVADDCSDCGGLHLTAKRFALVYDLRTGLPPSWPRLLPRTLVQTVSVEAAFDTTPLGMVDSPALKSIRLAAAQGAAARVHPGCPQTLHRLAGPFTLWPDARQGGIAVQPSRRRSLRGACSHRRGGPVQAGCAPCVAGRDHRGAPGWLSRHHRLV